MDKGSTKEDSVEKKTDFDNLYIYKNVADVPENAKKTIGAGRLKGMTDINPMWRIKALTEQFGPCGVGWKYVIDKQWLEDGSDDTICAFCNVSLYFKLPTGEWSEAIPGTGGSTYIAKERNGLYTSDEVYKMALTDALSVSCKALGVGADVYWQGGKDSKYSQITAEEYKCAKCGKAFEDFTTKSNKYYSAKQMYHISESKNGIPLCVECAKAVKETLSKAIEKERAATKNQTEAKEVETREESISE